MIEFTMHSYLTHTCISMRDCSTNYNQSHISTQRELVNYINRPSLIIVANLTDLYCIVLNHGTINSDKLS